MGIDYSSGRETHIYGTFGACTDDYFLAIDSRSTRSIEYQDSPQFAPQLLSKGIKFLVVGELKDGWHLYSIAHPNTANYASISADLRLYCSDPIYYRILRYDGGMSGGASQEKEKSLGVLVSKGPALSFR